MADFSVGLALVFPEIILLFSAIILLMTGVFLGEQANPVVMGLSIAALVASGTWIILFSGNGLAFGLAFVSDPFARIMKCMLLIGSILTLAMSVGLEKIKKSGTEKFEYPILILMATLGMMLMVSANDMLALYLGMELQSLALYVLVAMERKDSLSTEAGLKYFILGAVSSGLFLYGVSLVYGSTGHIGFEALSMAIQANGNLSMVLITGLVFILGGLAFKVSAAPFHMWTPDVYEGAPLPVSGFLASSAKIAAIAVCVRITMSAFPALIQDWQQIIIFLSMASMIVGSLGALRQKNIKRLIAYASIGQMGYALASLSTGTPSGIEGVVIHSLIYLITTLGVFAFVLGFQKRESKVDLIDDFAGVSYTHPLTATLLTLLMFSFAGIPPLAGFWGKWAVLWALVDKKLYFLAIVAILTSVVSAFYYLRIIKIVWFDEPVDSFQPFMEEMRLILVASGCFVLFYILFSSWVNGTVEAAVRAFF